MKSLTPEDIERYAHAHTTRESDVFRSLAEETRRVSDQAQMQVGPLEGMFLKLLARSLDARRILEIGTFTGYSALMLAEGAREDAEVITCDVDPATTDIARRFWNQSEHGHKITLRLGPALETLPHLAPPFDLVFIDADKTNYIRYWEECLPKVRRGGIILADNVLWSGRVLNPTSEDDLAIDAFNDHVLADKRVDAVVLTIRDGLTMACKR